MALQGWARRLASATNILKPLQDSLVGPQSVDAADWAAAAHVSVYDRAAMKGRNEVPQ